MHSCKDITALVKLLNGKLTKQDEFNEKNILELIRLHNIPGRIKEIIYRYELVNLFSTAFMNKIDDMEKAFFCGVNRNIMAMQEISKALSSEKNKPIVIKGYTNYIMTNNTKVIRLGDIDVLPYDIEEFVLTVKKLGYIKTKEPFMHEEGEYCKDEIEIDIHKFFPVYRYDALLKTEELKNTLKYEMPYEKICIDELERHCIRSDNYSDIVVADANIMILIICSHAFMNYTNIWSISHREKAYVKLGELWDILDLVNHSSYSESTLLKLAEKYQATDCMLWTGLILELIFKKNPLPIYGIKPNSLYMEFPKCLWWNIWERLSTTVEELLSNDWYDMDKVLNEIGYNQLCQGCYSSEELKKVYKIGAGKLLFELYDNLIIIYRKKNVQLDQEEHYRIDFGINAIEITISKNEILFGGDSKIIKSNVTSSMISVELVGDGFLLGYMLLNKGNCDENNLQVLIPIQKVNQEK